MMVVWIKTESRRTVEMIASCWPTLSALIAHSGSVHACDRAWEMGGGSDRGTWARLFGDKVLSVSGTSQLGL
eukprot:5357029-Pleurochrysis_carterae.AAC.1